MTSNEMTSGNEAALDRLRDKLDNPLAQWCTASDSGMQVGDCWCAECGEMRNDLATAELRSKAEQLQLALDVTAKQLAEAEAQKEQLRARLVTRNTDWSEAQTAMRELLCRWIEDETLDADDAKEAADILGVTLTRTVMVEGTFRVTMSVPFDWDNDKVEHNLSVEFEAQDDAEIEDSEFEVEDVITQG